jgi:tellurite resistance protein
MPTGSPLTPHEALVFAMVLVSAADRNMTDSELKAMGRIVTQAPAFHGFDAGMVSKVTDRCIAVLDQKDGLEKAFELMRAALPVGLRETAYAFAVEIAAADARATQEELRVLELIRHRLDVDRLAAAAIERGARARHARVR